MAAVAKLTNQLSKNPITSIRNSSLILQGGSYSAGCHRAKFMSKRRFHCASVLRNNDVPLTMSYCHMGSKNPLVGDTIGQALTKTTENFPDRDAVVFFEDGDRLTFSALHHQVEKFAAGLYSLGFRKGDRIGIWGPNHFGWILAQFATARIGVILVNVNPAYYEDELIYALNKVSCKGLILCPSFKTQTYYNTLINIMPELCNGKAGGIKSKRGTFSVDDIMAAGTATDMHAVEALQGQLQFDDPINVQFTSGTTGHPKGTVLTHHNLLNNAAIVGRNLGYDQEASRICVPVPLYHCFGMVLGSLCTVHHGATSVFPARGFNAKLAMEAIQNEKCTSVYGTPTMFIDMLHHTDFNQFDFSSLRTGIMAGSPCPEEVMKQVIEKMNCKEMTICYGLTETSPVTNQTMRTDSIGIRVSTIGRPIEHVEAKVIDQDGAIVPVNTPGEICFRGHIVMQNYWEDETKTREAIDEARWFHSGDVATIDEDRCCKIVGRLKDLVIRGGVNIFPREVEEFLYQHPKVEDVQVVGVSDERMGEELCAWIRLKSKQDCTTNEIKEFCKGKIAHFKIPRYIKFVDSYPLTVSGKVKKFVIRQLMEDELVKSRQQQG